MTRAISGLFFIVIFLANCSVTGLAADQPRSVLVNLEEYEIRLEDGRTAVFMPDGFVHNQAGEPALPWKHLFLSADEPISCDNLELIIREADTIELAAPLTPAQPPVPTWAESTPNSSKETGVVDYPDLLYPGEDCRPGLTGSWRGQPVLSISWCPFRYFPRRNLLEVIRRAEIRFGGDGQPGVHTEFAASYIPEEGFDNSRDFYQDNIRGNLPLARPLAGEEVRTIQTGTPTNVDYLIVANETLQTSLRPLAEWRQKQGYRVGIAFVSAITAAYPGEDVPAQIRAYLAEAYAGGLEFCVLGGDETVVPIRYAYHSYADEMPAYDRLQICDLYYADFTGDWDVDGDGIYGEYLQDNGDIYPEIYLGRLIAATPEQAEAIVAKILAYETNPGDGDPSFLTRALFTCTDQMRDWNGGEGQHTIIGARFPDYFDVDLESQSENPLGSLPDPEMPEGQEFVNQAGAGWGWLTTINHGRADGFILRSAGINEWPKSYVWSTGANGDGHGHLNLLAESGPPGIFLSVACNLGAFDMDGPLFGGFWGPNISEVLVQKPQGGAVAAISFSRWGWVGSSYRVIDKLIEYAFDPAVAPQLGVALTLAKTNFPYYRDQNYGLNLYGDPAMPHWTAPPENIQISHPAQVSVGSGAVSFSASDEGEPLVGALITASYADTIFFIGETDETGTAVWNAGPDRLGGYDITVTKAGYLPSRTQLVVPIVAGILEDEGESGLPFALEQNHPNPFNPTTTIEYALANTGQVRLEVYNVLGRRVNTLIDDRQSVGRHSVLFDGTDRHGSPLASGVYFYRLRAGNRTELKKMVLLR